MCSIQTIVRPLRVDAADRLDQLVAFALRQPAGDLVEQQQARVGGERARHFQPLAVEQRQRAADPVGLRGKAGLLEDLADLIDHIGLALVLAEAGGDQQVLGDRQLLEGMRHLVRAADAGKAAALRRDAGDVLAVELDRAGIGRHRAGDQREQRGLAGAVRADDAQRLALGDRQRDVVGHDQRAVGFAEVLDPQQHPALFPVLIQG